MEGEVIQSPADAVELGATNRPGRPTEMTIAIVTKLIEAFNNAYNITEACAYADISRTTFYRWLEQDDQFSYKMSQAQGAPNRKAKEIIVQAIVAGDVNTAKWYLNARDPDFKAKGELEISPEQLKKEDRLKEFMDDTDDGAYPDTADDGSAEPAPPTEPPSGGEVAQGPTDIS